MNPKQPRNLTPRLRFPEFRDAGEWEEKRLQAISEINPKREKLADEDLVSFVPMSSVSEDGYLIDYQVRMFSEVKKGFTFFRDRDIIFAKITPCFENGKAALLGGLKNGVGLGSTEFHVIRVGEACLPEFLFACLYTDKVRRLGKSAMTGSAGQQRVPSVFFEDYPIFLPALPEQQKIADCFTSLDALIAAHTQKLAALRAYKQGLLQQLFPAEGETLPRLRFPEFRDAGEWERKEVGEVFKVTRGEVLAMPLVQDKKTQKTPYPVYSSQTKNNGLAGFYSQYLYEDAITWTTDGANAGDVNYRSGKFFCTNVCGVLLNTEGYANSCIAALINSVSKTYVSYVGNPKLMNGVMSEIKIPFPSVAEQQKIANCLTALDALIAAQTQKLAALATHKKGLLQQLFPSPDEVQP